MKTKNLSILGLLFFALTWSASAQKISIPGPDFKKDMLSAFDPGSDLGITDKQKDELKKKNSSFLDDALSIVGGSNSDSDKLLSLKKLTGDQKGFMDSLLGDDIVKKYRKKIKKQIRPFKTKYKLAKLIL